MIQLLIFLAHVAFAHGQTNSTAEAFQQPLGDGAQRTVWGILSSCAVTLLICIWNAIHFDIDYDREDSFYRGPVDLVLWAIFGPEVVVYNAVKQWWEARTIVANFHEQGYEWSMTHCFFAEMGGFVYQKENGTLSTINSYRFLELCEEKKIANPLITVQEIKDRSKSDALGKTIFATQLLWFVVQAVARGVRGFAVTLIELDTVSMATLALLTLWVWWGKPHRPVCPHVFYSPRDVGADPPKMAKLKKAWKPESSFLSSLLPVSFILWVTPNEEKRLGRTKKHSFTFISVTGTVSDEFDYDHIVFGSFSVAWLILGGLHLIAWNFHFPTHTEMILWRVASLILTGSSVFALILYFTFNSDFCACMGGRHTFIKFALTVGVASRAILVGLMFASLRSLPLSAYETIAWTAYLPHLSSP